MKIVAVSQRIDSFPDRGEKRDALAQSLVEFLIETGFLTVPVPNNLCRQSPLSGRDDATNLSRWLGAVSPEAVVLSGGNDIGEYPERDQTENHLLSYAKRFALPTLGVCRGMQMLGHWAGASLKRIDGHAGTVHRIAGAIHGNVNSYHNFALVDCPDGFEVLARSVDGEIEAIRHKRMPWEGWMWHPEREVPFRDADLERVKILLSG